MAAHKSRHSKNFDFTGLSTRLRSISGATPYLRPHIQVGIRALLSRFCDRECLKGGFTSPWSRFSFDKVKKKNHHIKFQKTLTCIDRNLLVRQLQKSILVISSNLTTGTSRQTLGSKSLKRIPLSPEFKNFVPSNFSKTCFS